MDDIIKQIEEKYNALGQNPETYLKGLLHSKPLNYWDYVQVDALLNLQIQRTVYADEMIFIIYHQVTELLLKLIKHELEQVIFSENITPEVFTEKMERSCRYTEILNSSFGVMSKGMNYEDYNKFRLSLAPASGFQSVQFREIEIYTTDLINLVKHGFKEKATSVEESFNYLYWLDAGLDRKTGNKSLTLQQFEEKYLQHLIVLAYRCKKINIAQKFALINSSGNNFDALKNSLRKFDYLFNIKWPLTHLETAESYLIEKGVKRAATGMSDWQKYLHPSYQRRIFFPQLWSEDELKTWGHFTLS
ncbi:MAG: tryptophan 2,3-dioxygenase family protein [Bacteroidia bacterium]